MAKTIKLSPSSSLPTAEQAVDALLPLLVVQHTLIGDITELFLQCFPHLRRAEVAALLKACRNERLLEPDMHAKHYLAMDFERAFGLWQQAKPEWPQLWLQARRNLVDPPKDAKPSSKAIPLEHVADMWPCFCMLLILMGEEPCEEREWKRWQKLLQGQRFPEIFIMLGALRLKQWWTSFPPMLQPQLVACILQELAMTPDMPNSNGLTLVHVLHHIAQEGDVSARPSAWAALGVLAILGGIPEAALNICEQMPQGIEQLGLQAWAEWQMGRISLQEAYDRLPRPLPDVSGCITGMFWSLCLHKLQFPQWTQDHRALFPSTSDLTLLPFGLAYRHGVSPEAMWQGAKKADEEGPETKDSLGELLEAMNHFMVYGEAIYRATVFRIIHPSSTMFFMNIPEGKAVINFYLEKVPLHPLRGLLPDLIAIKRPIYGERIPLEEWRDAMLRNMPEVKQCWLFQQQGHQTSSIDTLKMRLLEAIDQLARPQQQGQVCYVWDKDVKEVVPYIQRMGKTGRMLKPKRTSWLAFSQGEPFFRPTDWHVASCLLAARPHEYTYDPELLVDNAQLLDIMQERGELLDADLQPMQVEVRPIRLDLVRLPDGFWIRFEQPLPIGQKPYTQMMEEWLSQGNDPYWPCHASELVKQEKRRDGTVGLYFEQQGNRLVVFWASDTQLAVASAIGPHGMRFPLEAEAQLKALLPILREHL